MRFPIGIALVCLSLSSFACGGGDQGTDDDEVDPRFGTVTTGGGRAKLEIDPSDRPPPKTVLIRDLKKGSGPAAGWGDWAYVRFVGVNYNTGKVQYRRWFPAAPLPVQLGLGGSGIAWEEAVDGMRAGGRREFIIPSHLLFDTGTIDYVVDLVRIKSSVPQ